jgi:hypothetical protein
MNELSNRILTYFLANLQRLPNEKQFHFASRLHLWDQDPAVAKVLATLRPWFTADGNSTDMLRGVKQRAADQPDFGSKNVLAVRQPYFEQYPELTDYIPVLLQIMYSRTVYGIDCREEFQHIFPIARVNECAERLLADEAAMAMLSSQAINFLYTWGQLSQPYEAKLTPKHFLSVGQTRYDLTNKLHLQLLIYFYTHCIIGATHFYYRPVPVLHQETYKAMIHELEMVITNNYRDINLDNKFEFLVACSMLGYRSQCADRIMDEASDSISKDGQFLVDRHNNNPQRNNESFDRSEHRNVLFLLGTRPYHPLGS